MGRTNSGPERGGARGVGAGAALVIAVAERGEGEIVCAELRGEATASWLLGELPEPATTISNDDECKESAIPVANNAAMVVGVLGERREGGEKREGEAEFVVRVLILFCSFVMSLSFVSFIRPICLTLNRFKFSHDCSIESAASGLVVCLSFVLAVVFIDAAVFVLCAFSRFRLAVSSPPRKDGISNVIKG